MILIWIYLKYYMYICSVRFVSYQEYNSCKNSFLSYKSLSIIALALSMTVVSSDARYICVVVSESCPMPSHMTEMGTFLCLAALAHEWRATYMVRGMSRPTIRPMSLSLRLMRYVAF